MKRRTIDHGKQVRRDGRRAETVSPVVAIPAGQDAALSDVELLRRAVIYTHPYGFEVVEKWRMVGMLFGVDRAVAQRLCKRFGVNPDEKVAR
jgi:hypothetical protein